MQRPPDRNPTILFSRSAADWIRNVQQKHKELIELQLTTEQQHKIDRLIETQFVDSTLRLEGLEIPASRLGQLMSVASAEQSMSDIDRSAISLVSALRKAVATARTHGKAAELTPDFLVGIHTLEGASGFRTSEGGGRLAKPVPAESLPALIEIACQWYSAESFAELNPIEQSAIVLLRLIELQPFEESNQRTALVAASLFTLRSELPPIIIKPEMKSAYDDALAEASGMNTKPMVDVIGESVGTSLGEMLALSKKG